MGRCRFVARMDLLSQWYGTLYVQGPRREQGARRKEGGTRTRNLFKHRTSVLHTSMTRILVLVLVLVQAPPITQCLARKSDFFVCHVKI